MLADCSSEGGRRRWASNTMPNHFMIHRDDTLATEVVTARYPGVMATKTDELHKKALALSNVERAHLAAELLVSLEPSPDEDPTLVMSLWATEIERRARRVIASGAAGQDWKIVRQRAVDILDK